MADKKLAATNFVSLGLRLYQHNPFVCYVLIKDHKGSTDATSGLFVSGLPLGLQKESTLAAVLSCFGPVASVVLHGSKVRGLWQFGSSLGLPWRWVQGTRASPGPVRHACCAASLVAAALIGLRMGYEFDTNSSFSFG